MSRAGNWFSEHVVDWSGSTRGLALMRIGVVLVAWARLSEQLRPFDDLAPERLVLGGSFFAASSLLLIGRWTPIAAVWHAINMVVIYQVFGLGWFGVDRVEPWSHHHVYTQVATAVLLALTPCGRSLSLDRWLQVRRAERAETPLPPETGALWAVRLIQLQVVAMYLWTTWDKLFWAFINGERHQQYAAWLYFGGDLPEGIWFTAMTATMGSVTVVVEGALPILLLIPRTRSIAIVSGIVLHGLIFLLLPVSTFSMSMWVLYIAFVDPSYLHQLIDRLLGHGRASAVQGPGHG
ncbi:MAG: HTTM domain-containing protein [Myxococcota bacterium]